MNVNTGKFDDINERPGPSRSWFAFYRFDNGIEFWFGLRWIDFEWGK